MLVAMATVLLGFGGYAVLCAVKPFGPCRRCRGTGRSNGLGSRGRAHAATDGATASVPVDAPTTPGVARMRRAAADLGRRHTEQSWSLALSRHHAVH